MYEVELTDAARKVYEAADRPLTKKLNRCFDRLAADPRASNSVTQLRGVTPPIWRFRVGDWRVLYTIDDAARLVTVREIVHRSDIYG